MVKKQTGITARQIRATHVIARDQLQRYADAIKALPDSPEKRELKAATTDILRVMLSKKRPPKPKRESIRVLVQVMRSHPGPDPLLWLERGGRFTIDPWWEVVDGLRTYAHYAEIVGNIHSFCRREGCSEIVSGRRGQLFCSPECHREFWSYKNQPEYWKEKQAKYYGIHNRFKKKKARRP
jgi:hypothetical protein